MPRAVCGLATLASAIRSRPTARNDCASPVVPGLRGAIDECRSALYCRLNNTQFSGKLLCRKCQRQPASPAPKSPPAAQTEQAKATEEIAARCANCGSGVDKKVVAYCRFNSKRLGGRVLCRSCQASVA